MDRQRAARLMEAERLRRQARRARRRRAGSTARRPAALPSPAPALPTPAELDAARTARGGWTRETLAAWGVPRPPPTGWRRALKAMRSRGAPRPLGWAPATSVVRVRFECPICGGAHAREAHPPRRTRTHLAIAKRPRSPHRGFRSLPARRLLRRPRGPRSHEASVSNQPAVVADWPAQPAERRSPRPVQAADQRAGSGRRGRRAMSAGQWHSEAPPARARPDRRTAGAVRR